MSPSPLTPLLRARAAAGKAKGASVEVNAPGGAKASVSEKAVLATKVRRLTPGAEGLILRWGLEESN